MRWHRSKGVGEDPLARQRPQLVPHRLPPAQEVAGQKQHSSISQVRQREPQGCRKNTAAVQPRGAVPGAVSLPGGGGLLPLVPHRPSQEVSGKGAGATKAYTGGWGAKVGKGQAGGWKGIQGLFPI